MWSQYLGDLNIYRTELGFELTKASGIRTQACKARGDNTSARNAPGERIRATKAEGERTVATNARGESVWTWSVYVVGPIE